MDGCGFSRPVGLPRAPVLGVCKSLDVRGVSTAEGIGDMYVASKETWICDKRSKRISGGLLGSAAGSPAGFLIRRTSSDCNCSSGIDK